MSLRRFARKLYPMDQADKPPVPPPALPPKMPLSDEQVGKIIAALNSKGVRGACPRCGNENFMLAPGTVSLSLQPPGAGGLVLGGPAIPSAVAICSRCGFIAAHALGTLGFINEKGEVTL